MKNLIVVESLADWNLNVPNTDVVLDYEYLTHPDYQNSRSFRVYNLCRTISYQSLGYYVSLLAAGPRPSPKPVRSDPSRHEVHVDPEDTIKEYDALLQKSLQDIHSDEFDLSVYFGKNLAKKYNELAHEIEKLYHTPLLRAKFHYKEKWRITSVAPIALRDVPKSHLETVVEFAKEYFASRRRRSAVKMARFSLAILINPKDTQPPSNERALKKFIKAARDLRIDAELITRDDYSRLAEFDGLFIRETTHVAHHTFRFAQKAAALGIVVIDDPESIMKCTNKVYLAELLGRHRFSVPSTRILYRDNADTLREEVSYPCILKRPDGAFSKGVEKVRSAGEFAAAAARMLLDSDLVIVQEFLPTDFDWRVGVLGGRPLFVSKYFMAKNHWQIYKTSRSGKVIDGQVQTFAIADAPRKLLDTACRAASLIGDGLYGLDIKERSGKYYIIEINDNPNIDVGCEDQVLKDELYAVVMNHFLERMMRKSEGITTEDSYDKPASF